MRDERYPTHPDDELDPDVRPHMGVTYVALGKAAWLAIEGVSVPIERPSNEPGGASAARPSYPCDFCGHSSLDHDDRLSSGSAAFCKLCDCLDFELAPGDEE